MTTITLVSGDGKEFSVAKSAITLSGTVKNMMEDIGDVTTPIPLPNVTGDALAKILLYLDKHVAMPPEKKDEFTAWETEYCNVPNEQLFDLILAANYLDIALLLDATCKELASRIKGKSPEEIRQTFGIKNDFTPEEEEHIRKENEWCGDE